MSGATGVSFGTLKRSLAGTKPQPTPSPDASTPTIITPGHTTGGAGGITDTDGGALASTGAQVGALVGFAALLVATGWRTAVVAHRRATRNRI
ncbi:hypothetical protein OHT61_04125 [Streptomyces sp. NBC_00178]|uniref:hypothetical protein n=1 Tax=Streptomyces sp. NBC_00178 TaxID=2975672 RepID=UPI002E2A0ED1|nr:hypothetical protein [Streptomyces sp. NBC_00178]